MALFNYATKEITLKVVYYGPGLSGKTTNLQYLHSILNPETKGRLLSLATESDRTLFFDFLPVELGKIRDFSIRFQLYTVPGQIRYNATRKVVLKGADAVVFVADSQTEMKEQNIESLTNMRENLFANNINPDDIPIILQYNKRDLNNVASIEEMNNDLNPNRYHVLEASAINGTGVEDSFKLITKLLLKHIAIKHKIEIIPPAREAAARPYEPELPVESAALAADELEVEAKTIPEIPSASSGIADIGKIFPTSPEPVEIPEISAHEFEVEAETIPEIPSAPSGIADMGKIFPTPSEPIEMPEISAHEFEVETETIPELPSAPSKIPGLGDIFPSSPEAVEPPVIADEFKVQAKQTQAPSGRPPKLSQLSNPLNASAEESVEEIEMPYKYSFKESIKSDDSLQHKKESGKRDEYPVGPEKTDRVQTFPIEKIDLILTEIEKNRTAVSALITRVSELHKEIMELRETDAKEIKEIKKEQRDGNNLLREIIAIFNKLKTKKQWFTF